MESDNRNNGKDQELATLLRTFHELRKDAGVIYAGADPLLRAVLLLTVTVDQRLREKTDNQARIVAALEALADVGVANAVGGGLP